MAACVHPSPRYQSAPTPCVRCRLPPHQTTRADFVGLEPQDTGMWHARCTVVHRALVFVLTCAGAGVGVDPHGAWQAMFASPCRPDAMSFVRTPSYLDLILIILCRVAPCRWPGLDAGPPGGYTCTYHGTDPASGGRVGGGGTVLGQEPCAVECDSSPLCTTFVYVPTTGGCTLWSDGAPPTPAAPGASFCTKSLADGSRPRVSRVRLHVPVLVVFLPDGLAA